jgi:FSR family fosmidomycin resistance protein-like MFS transporter
MKKRLIALLTTGHFVTDINQGALPALLPFLIAKHGLSYTSAAALILASTVSSSVIQPAFGFWADKVSALWVMALGMFLAGAGLAVAGVVPNYWQILVCVAISGIGIAAFHPEAAKIANLAAGEKKATGVSTFVAGGNLGFAFGPLVVTLILSAAGLGGTLFMLAPVTVVAILFTVNQKRIALSKQHSQALEDEKCGDLPGDNWSAFLLLTGGVICRSIFFFGLNTFLPLYWITVLKQSKTAGSAALSGLLVLGAIATLVSGRLSDKYGHRRLVIWGFAALIPFTIIFSFTNGLMLSSLMLVPMGISLYMSFSPMVVLGQKYIPHHMGLASGVTMGLAVSVGGVFTPVLGLIADQFGLKAVMQCITILPVIALLISLKLPAPTVTSISRQ